MNNKKRNMVIASLFLLILIVFGTTYALWTRTKVQVDENEITATCLSVELENSDNNVTGFTLNGAYPMEVEEGLSLTGYNFKVVNSCDSYVKYTINLESLTTVAAANRISLDYVDAIIDNAPANVLTYYETTDSLLQASDGTAYDTRKLEEGIVGPNTYTEHTLRLWMDIEAPNEMMRKNYEAKLSVSAQLYAYNETPVNAVTYLTNKAASDDSLVYDDAIDTTTETNNNLRFVGANPDNYVYFNDELWRIIGVMKDIDGGTVSGDNATRVKIIKATDIGHYPYYDDCLDENMSYDSTTDKWACSSRRYNNNWPNSTANEILNDLYWNRKTHVPYNGWMYLKTGDQTAFTWQDYKTESLDFRNSGLKKVYQNMMETATYYLGGYTWGSDTYSGSTMNSKQYYTAERTNQGNNNELTWTGNLGLMYPSDYGYASSGTVSGTSCRNIALREWDSSTNAPCRNNDWLFNGAFSSWTMTPRADHSNYVASVYASGFVDYNTTFYGFAVRPVLYLKSTIKIVGGNGKQATPYKLSL